MANLAEKLSLYLHYPFVRYALIVGVLIALCSSLLGVTLVQVGLVSQSSNQFSLVHIEYPP